MNVTADIDVVELDGVAQSGDKRPLLRFARHPRMKEHIIVTLVHEGAREQRLQRIVVADGELIDAVHAVTGYEEEY